MRIRRRPAAFLASSPPTQTPDLLSFSEELPNTQPWSQVAGEPDSTSKEQGQLHPSGDLKLKTGKTFTCFNPDQCNLSSLSSSIRDPKESHSDQNPLTDDTERSSGAPTSPAKKSWADTRRASNGEAKKRRSPAVLMEGSRCSRVNGRGWRCSQPTLVGYSLCEHHLGKGRLRSMSSVKGQLGSSSMELEKKKKIGVVKAKSISSILGYGMSSMASPEMALLPLRRTDTERE